MGVYYARDPIDLNGFAVFVDTAVEHSYSAVFEHGVGRRGVTHTMPLKAVGEFGDLVPEPCVAFEIDMIDSDGRRQDLIHSRRASPNNPTKGQK